MCPKREEWEQSGWVGARIRTIVHFSSYNLSDLKVLPAFSIISVALVYVRQGPGRFSVAILELRSEFVSHRWRPASISPCQKPTDIQYYTRTVLGWFQATSYDLCPADGGVQMRRYVELRDFWKAWFVDFELSEKLSDRWWRKTRVVYPIVSVSGMQSGPLERSDRTKPQTGSLGLDGLGLDRSTGSRNPRLVSTSFPC
jgi:hypothetical protein